MHSQCVFCQLRLFERHLNEYLPEKEKQSNATHEFISFLANIPDHTIAPEIALEMQKIIFKYTGIRDPYKEIKIEYNQLLLSRLSNLREQVLKSSVPIQTAFRFAIAGNIIDFGANPNFNISATIEKVLSEDYAINDSKELIEKIRETKNILYLGDNAGEIVMDRLLIETINHPSVTFSVRNSAILNDVTIEDANMVGINELAKVISTGYDGPTILLQHCSNEFKAIYEKADVIISKGQGNFEGLWGNENKNIFFLLMIKCSIVSEILGAELGGYVLVRNKPELNRSQKNYSKLS